MIVSRLALYFLSLAGGLSACLALIKTHERSKAKQGVPKINDETFRMTLSKLKGDFDKVRAGNKEDADIFGKRLMSFIDLYLKDHKKQAKYLNPIKSKLEQIQGPSVSYTIKLKNLRGAVEELARPIEND